MPMWSSINAGCLPSSIELQCWAIFPGAAHEPVDSHLRRPGAEPQSAAGRRPGPDAQPIPAADDLALRAAAPDQQQLLQVTEYAVVVGNQRQSTQQPIPVTSPLMIRLKGKSLNKGATIAQVILNFDAESKSLKK